MALSSKGAFSINGHEFIASAMKVNFESLATEDSGRADDGAMVIGWVYRRLRKVEIEMPPCSSAAISSLFSLVQGQEYSMTYFDPLTNNWRTGRFYTSNAKSDMYSGVVMNGLYQGVGFHAIELAGE